MALGVAAGPRVGELLRAVETWWIAGDFAAEEQVLREQLRKLVASS
jgi:poly(A) polymerase